MFKQENIKLKQQLEIILKNAHDNEEKLKRFEKIEFSLMDANSLSEILDILFLEYPSLFNINFSTLILFDEKLSIKPLINTKTIKKEYANNLSLLHFPSAFEKFTPLTKKIYLGNYLPIKHRHLTNHSLNNQQSIQSIAILPLIRHHQTIGIFSCISTQKNRFEPCSGVDFMKHLSYIISVCIENVLNYEQLKLCSLTDPLTKIRNRRFFDQSLKEEVTRVQRSQPDNQLPLSCLLLDIDHFKKVNDNYGHTAGDEILIQVVRRIQKTLRSHEILARYGGEEFILLLPETDNSVAFKIAQRIILEVNKSPIPIDENQSLTITISIGLATLKNSFYSKEVNFFANQLVEHADKALYQAKETGRNKVCNEF